MTAKTENALRKRSASYRLSAFIFLIVSIYVIIFSKRISEATLYGIRLSALNVIPSLFPFFILSDLLTSSVEINNKGFLSRAFSKTFSISPAGLGAFALGAIGGFPLGVKCAARLYEKGEISKSELERLIGIVNNPSPAFVITAVGALMLGNALYGLILYFAVSISAIISGLIFKQECNFSQNSDKTSGQNFNLINSIKSAGESSIVISSFIIFFSTVIGALSVLINDGTTLAIASSLFEIGNAASRISALTLPLPVMTALLGFALGFSGLSVHLQAFALLPKEISKRRYLFMKCLQGLLTAALSGIVFTVFL